MESNVEITGNDELEFDTSLQGGRDNMHKKFEGGSFENEIKL